MNSAKPRLRLRAEEGGKRWDEQIPVQRQGAAGGTGTI
jgi:hypothetical protein